MEKNLDITKPRFSERILPHHWPFVISGFYCKSKYCNSNRLITEIRVQIVAERDISIPNSFTSYSGIRLMKTS